MLLATMSSVALPPPSPPTARTAARMAMSKAARLRKPSAAALSARSSWISAMRSAASVESIFPPFSSPLANFPVQVEPLDVEAGAETTQGDDDETGPARRSARPSARRRGGSGGPAREAQAGGGDLRRPILRRPLHPISPEL